MSIFDRWGIEVFLSEDLNIGWDGTYKGNGGDAVPFDVYVYQIKFFNKVSKDRLAKYVGRVTVLK